MSRRWIVPVVLGVTAGIVAYGVTKHFACGTSERPVDRLQDVSFLTRTLRLTEGQARAIRELNLALGAKLDDCCQRHCEARARLSQTLEAVTNGMGRADALLVEMSRAYEESERASLSNIQAVRAVLNDGQRAQFDRMLSKCLCRPGTCSMPGADVRMGGAGILETRTTPRHGKMR